MGSREKKHILMGSPSVSVIISTYNSDRTLDLCLQSIQKQEYPKAKVEILIVDGGSQDETLDIAKKYGCLILKNPEKLAEPGIALGLTKSRGDICTILAADNVLADRCWIRRMLKPFANETIFAAFPKHISNRSDSWFTRYLNTFTDAFNHFVYGAAANSRTFYRAYQILEQNRDYIVYDFKPENHPILAFAQGFTIRKGYQRPPGMKYDDLLPVIDLIGSGKKIAYVPLAAIYHHSITNLSHFVKKQRWAVDNALLGKPYGIWGRRKYLSKKRRLKQYLWLIYSLSFVLPLVLALWGVFRDREKAWIYHPVISFLSASLFLNEFMRIKVLRRSAVGSRQ